MRVGCDLAGTGQGAPQEEKKSPQDKRIYQIFRGLSLATLAMVSYSRYLSNRNIQASKEDEPLGLEVAGRRALLAIPTVESQVPDQFTEKDTFFQLHLDPSEIFDDMDGDGLSLNARQADASDLPSWISLNHPIPLLSTTSTFSAESMFVIGDYAFVADDLRGLKTYNVTDATNPTLLHEYFGLSSSTVAVNGTTLFVQTAASGVAILDVSNQTAPQVISRIETTDLQDLFYLDNSLYVADGFSGLKIYDVSDPFFPFLVGETAGWSEGFVTHVSVSDGLAYLSASLGIEIVDVSSPSSPSLIGSFATSGLEGELVVNGTTAYFSIRNSPIFPGGRVVALDVSNPANPVKLSEIDTFTPEGIAFFQNYVCLADGGEGLKIIDATNSSNLGIVGSIDPGVTLEVEIQGNLAYLASRYDGFNVIAISNPQLPVQIGFFDTSGSAVDLAVDGTNLFLSDGDHGPKIFDVSNPASPSFVGKPSPLFTQVDSVTVSNGVAYVADSSTDVITALDVSDPASPQILSEYNQPAAHIRSIGNFAYAVKDQTFQVIDVSNPTLPFARGFVNTEKTRPAFDLEVNGDFAYLGYGTEGTHIIDISDPDNLQNILSFESHSFESRRIRIYGDHGFLPDGSQGLKIIDYADVSTPSILGVYKAANVNFKEVVVVGNNAYLADVSNGLDVVNVVNVANPQKIGSLGGFSGESLAVQGNYCYIATGVGGFKIIDISIPAFPMLIGEIGSSIYGVEVLGNYAYTASNNGLIIYDISSPSSPSVAGISTPTVRYPRKVLLNGGLAYLTGQDLGIVTVDISNVAAPVVLNSTPERGYGSDMFLAGNVLLHTGSDEGLNLYNMTDPSMPTFITAFNTEGSAQGVFAQGNYAFVGDFFKGPKVLDFSDPTNPSLVSNFKVFDTRGLTVSDSKLFLADGEEGFTIVDISTPANPTLISSLSLNFLAYDVAIHGSVAFVAHSNAVSVIDIFDPADPKLSTILSLATSPTVDAPTISVSGDRLYLTQKDAGFTIFDLSQWKMEGTPSQADEGSFDIELFATDRDGNQASDIFKIFVGDVFVLNPILDQSTSVNNPFQFVFPSNSFFDLENRTLTYSSELESGANLPSWLNFAAGLRQFSGLPVSGDQGSYRIKVVAENPDSETVNTIFNITVANANPNVVFPISDQNLNVGTELSINLNPSTFVDTDGDALAYSASLVGGAPLPAWLNFDVGLFALFGTPLSGDQGKNYVSVLADDGFGGIGNNTFKLDIANRVPIGGTGFSTLTAPVGQIFNTVFGDSSFIDGDGDELLFRAQRPGGIPLPGWLRFNETARQFIGTPLGFDRTTEAIELIVSDGFGGELTDAFSIDIPNTAPILENQVPDQNAVPDSPFNFAFAPNTFFDVDGDPLAYFAELSNGDPLPTWLTFIAVSRLFSGTPLITDRGSLNVRINANDSLGGEVDATFRINVDNSSPTLASSLSDNSVFVGQNMLYSIPSNSFSDADGDPINYTVTNILPNWIQFDDVSDTFSGSPFTGDQGTFPVNIQASDGFGGIGETSFTVSVPNRAPVRVSFSDEEWENEGEVFSILWDPAGFIDLDGDMLGYTVEGAFGSSLPGWMGFDSPTMTLSGLVPLGAVGPVPILVNATDPFGGRGNVIVNFYPNHAPQLSGALPNQEAVVDNPFLYTFSGSTFLDSDGHSLTYNATQLSGNALPNWLSFNPLLRSFSGTPASADKGVVFIKVRADDPYDGDGEGTFGITISDTQTGNTPPQLASSLLDQTAGTQQLFQYTVPTNSFIDPDGDDLTYEATLEGGGNLPSWLVFDGDTKTFTGVPSEATVIRLSVTAQDGKGGIGLDTFTLIVEDSQNFAPRVVNPISNQVATVGQKFSFAVSDTTFQDDNQGDLLTYRARRLGGDELPSWLTFDPTSRVFEGKAQRDDTGSFNDKVYKIEVLASDGELETAEVFDITVQGTSYQELLLSILGPAAAIGGLALAWFKNRGAILNPMNRKKYQKQDDTIQIGTSNYERVLSVPVSEVKLVKAYSGRRVIGGIRLPERVHNSSISEIVKHDKPLPGGINLPAWLEYNHEANALVMKNGGPQKPGTYLIRVYSHGNVIKEEFRLEVEDPSGGSASAPPAGAVEMEAV